ncbi:hypothetical protein [Photobacterium minamisatsumaniensis]|uniref:hypothetical protein n=1 Tax=Photobacterium minamisatsumaniensis TaxID=2910233 RepID=UPI003D119F21
MTMLECHGDLSIEVGGCSAHITVQDQQFIIDMSDSMMLCQFLVLYRQLPNLKWRSQCYIPKGYQLVFTVSSLATIVVTPRRGWLSKPFPLKLSISNKCYWLKVVPYLFIYQFKRLS